MTVDDKIDALVQLKNIGLKSADWMVQVGVDTPEKLAEVGAAETYLRLKKAYPKNTMACTLWALQGAIDNVASNHVAPDQKAMLKERVQQAMGDGQ